jgi:hypothetical protein
LADLLTVLPQGKTILDASRCTAGGIFDTGI